MELLEKKQETKETEKSKKVLFLTYGTLKQGYGNYSHYLQNRSKFLGKFTTEPKYTMFNGGFPIVERDGSDVVQGELHETEDISAIRGVFGLEGCSSQKQGDSSNWYDFDYIDTPYGKAVMFVMDKGKSRRSESSILIDGNWGR